MPPLLKFPFSVSSFSLKTNTHPQFLLHRRLSAAATITIPSPPALLPRWRISPCVFSNKVFIGFRATQYSLLSSYNKGGGGAGEGVLGAESGGGSSLLTDMGSETSNTTIRDEQLLQNDHQNHRSNNKAPETPVKQPRYQSNKFITLPTILTIGRVAAVPLLVCTFYMDSWWGNTATTSIFIAAAITDWLDGYLARKLKLGSAFGAFLDPVADKLMVAATLVLLCTRPPEVSFFGHLPWLLTIPSIAIIGREITMSAVREWAASQSSKLSEAVAVNSLGKWKTATQMTALTILLVTRDDRLAGAGAVASGVTLLYISAWLAVWSLFVYMKKIWKVLLT